MSERPRPFPFVGVAIPFLAVATAAAQAPLCEEVFFHPETGHPTTLAVQITSPLPGDSLRAFDPGCPAEIVVEGVASTVGIPPRFDFYLVIDESGSTRSGSGVDVDGDGVQDSILEAELAAARSFVEALDLVNSRVAVIYFSSSAYVAQPLTADIGMLRLALAFSTPSGNTNYGDAMIQALAEHAANHDPSRDQVILFLSDGAPNRMSALPPGTVSCPGFSMEACCGIAWAEEAAARGIIVDTFAVGTGANPDVLTEMAARGSGRFFDIDVAGEVIDVVPRVIHVGVRDVLVVNETTGGSVVVAPGPDGRFQGALAIAEGRNEIRVVARALEVPTWETTCLTDVSSTCILWNCPAPVDQECALHSEIIGFRAWSSETDVAIVHDSAHAHAPGADASGAYPLGRTDVTWTFSDAVAGSRACSSSVTLRDTLPPVFAGVPADAVHSCMAPPAATPTVADACDPAPTITFEEIVTPGDCPDRFELLRRWRATDLAGHVTEVEQTIVVRDDEAPVMDGLPASDEVAACDAVPPLPIVTATDQCDPAPALGATEDRIDGPCSGTYRLVRTWTAADRCGNAVSATRTVGVRDDRAPVLIGVPADVTVDCLAVPPPPEVTATDTCSEARVTFVERSFPGPCAGSHDLEREWTAIDDCGNTSTAMQRVAVRDTTPPRIAADPGHVTCLWPPRHDEHVLDASDFGLSFSDDCSGPVTWSFSDCVSDQPGDARGDGSTAGDCAISPDGHSLVVRAERQGQGAGRHVGRTYSVAVIAVDACGNSTPPSAVGIIAVPHDRSDHDRTCGR